VNHRHEHFPIYALYLAHRHLYLGVSTLITHLLDPIIDALGRVTLLFGVFSNIPQNYPY
jgi:hypothetical protein